MKRVIVAWVAFGVVVLGGCASSEPAASERDEFSGSMPPPASLCELMAEYGSLLYPMGMETSEELRARHDRLSALASAASLLVPETQRLAFRSLAFFAQVRRDVELAFPSETSPDGDGVPIWEQREKAFRDAYAGSEFVGPENFFPDLDEFVNSECGFHIEENA